jgi:uncharacterized protein
MNIEESEIYAAELVERKEYHEAERLLISLADQDSAYAMMALAWIYENGYLNGENVKAAQYYYDRAISHGRTDAYFGLGHLLLGNGRESEARKVFERGAEKGHVGCIGELGWIQVNGTGGDVLEAEGQKKLEEASSRGHLLAQSRIVRLELSRRPSLIKRIELLKRRASIMWKTFFELYKNKNSDKVW